MNPLSYTSWLSQARIWRVLFFALMLSVVLYAGSRPGSTDSASDYWISYCLNLAHQPLFAMVALSALLAMGQKVRTRAALLLGVGLALLIGIGDEIHQASVESRLSSIWDLGSDVLGATFGIIVAGWSDQRSGLFDFLLPMAGLFVVSLLWNILPTFAYSYPLPFYG